MTAPQQQPASPMQKWGMLLAIVVVLACIFFVGRQLVNINQQPGAETDSQGSLLTYEIARAAQAGVKTAIKTGTLDYKLVSRSNANEVYDFSIQWSPFVDLYAASDKTPPATLELQDLGLTPTILKWAQAHPDQVKSFVGIDNPMAKFKIISQVAAAGVPRTASGTITKDSASTPTSFDVAFTDDALALSGKPLYTFGPSALTKGSDEHKAMIVATGQLKLELARNLLSAYELHIIQSENAPGARRQSANDTPADAAESAVDAQATTGGGQRNDKTNKGQADKNGAGRRQDPNRMAQVLAQKQAEIEKARQDYLAPLFAATKPDTVWTGQWSAGADVGPIGIRFTRQTQQGELAGHLFDPDNPQTTKDFTGRITLDPKNADGWPIRLSMVPESGFPPAGPDDYKGARGWLQKNDSYLIFIRLDSNQALAGRTTRRAALMLYPPGYIPKTRPMPVQQQQSPDTQEPGAQTAQPETQPASEGSATTQESNATREQTVPVSKRPLITQMRPETDPEPEPVAAPQAVPAQDDAQASVLSEKPGAASTTDSSDKPQRAEPTKVDDVETAPKTPETSAVNEPSPEQSAPVPGRPMITNMRPETDPEPEPAAAPLTVPAQDDAQASVLSEKPDAVSTTVSGDKPQHTEPTKVDDVETAPKTPETLTTTEPSPEQTAPAPGKPMITSMRPETDPEPEPVAALQDASEKPEVQATAKASSAADKSPEKPADIALQTKHESAGTSEGTPEGPQEPQSPSPLIQAEPLAPASTDLQLVPDLYPVTNLEPIPQ